MTQPGPPPYDPNHPTGGGNFNPNIRIDTSHASSSGPQKQSIPTAAEIEEWRRRQREWLEDQWRRQLQQMQREIKKKLEQDARAAGWKIRWK